MVRCNGKQALLGSNLPRDSRMQVALSHATGGDGLTMAVIEPINAQPHYLLLLEQHVEVI